MLRRALLQSPLRSLRSVPFPNVPVQTHRGETLHFYEDLVRGKVVTLNFMYAECTGICPGMTANLLKVQAELGDRVGSDIFMYSLTLKPKHDTAQVLNAYARDHHVKPGWLFLTGQPDDLELLRRRLGFVDSDPALDADASEHIGLVRFGNEPLGRWAACPALSRPGQIVDSILGVAGPRKPVAG
jgi:protein SCO1